MSKNDQIRDGLIVKVPTQRNGDSLGDNAVATNNLQDLSVTTPKYANQSITGVKMAADGIDTVNRASKNYVINGDMRISQRGTSFTSIADTAYSIDRFKYNKTGAMVHNATQDTDVPTMAQAGYLFQNSLRLNLTTPDTSIAATDSCNITHIIEGYNFTHIAQKAFTISFWVKATTTGTYCASVHNSGSDRCYVAEYVVNVTDTWEFKTINVAASPSTGTWNYSNGNGLIIRFTLAEGTTAQTATINAWQTGNFRATANQVNGVNTGSTNFRITGIMVNEGALASAFRTFSGGSVNEELLECQRYYEKSYNQGINPGTSGYNGVIMNPNPTTSIGNTRMCLWIPFKVRKRGTPSCVLYGITGTSGRLSNYTSATDFAAGSASVSNAHESGIDVFNNSGGGITPIADQGVACHFTADAEL